MAFQQSDIDVLDRMIAQGVLRTVYNGNTVEYRSMDDLLKARALMAAEIGAGASRSTVTDFCNGLRS